MNALRDHRLPDGTLLLRSTMLESSGFPHAFSTAIGPDERPFDLSRPGHSPMETPKPRLEEDLRRFAAAISSEAILASPRQVHGIEVVAACDADELEADSVRSSDPDLIAAVRTADCVPILVACARRNEVVAVHAGWRGLVADAPGHAIRELVDRGSRPEELLAAIGPAIGVEAFEIGTEVADRFESADLGLAVRVEHSRPHADLHLATRRRLLGAGIPASRIDGDPACTATSRRFFSHRRDEGRTGRHLAGISPRPASLDS